MENSDNPDDVLNHQPVTPRVRRIGDPLTDRVLAVVLSCTFIFVGLLYRYNFQQVALVFWPRGVGVLSIVAFALVTCPKRFDRLWNKLLFAVSVMLLFVISILVIQSVRLTLMGMAVCTF